MAGLQTNIYIAAGFTWPAAFLALVLRFIARRITKIILGYEDYFCIIAFVSTHLSYSITKTNAYNSYAKLWASGYCSLTIYWTVHWFLGQYIPSDLDQAAKDTITEHGKNLSFYASLTYAFSIGFSKLTILLLYWRIFKYSTIRIPIQVMFCVTTVWVLVRLFLLLFRCTPISAYWDPDVPGRSCPINDVQFAFATILAHTIIDCIILILPIIEIVKLRLPLGQKLAVVALFLVGSNVFLASIFVFLEADRVNVNTTQMLHDYAPSFMWAIVETNLAVISANLPLLRPVFRYIAPSWFLSSGYPNHSTSRFSHAVRLNSIVTRNPCYSGQDETGSTHQLAGIGTGYSEPLQFEPVLVQKPKSARTAISSETHKIRSDEACGAPGVYGPNSVVVEVEESEHVMPLGR
ncbi:unnamed protein product [Clonostachys chloroleuca]|uniref:Rhodopsin domain-containing protein n=1 Tax=Clonostachys chloroleuca TaxID=1926264 RepID=A0AA35Q0F7_9HYPO|nr:unnamed protein product [Clonostachys chloroleuca]